MRAHVDPSTSVAAHVPAGASARVGVGSPISRVIIDRDPYEGPYEVTPTQQTQTLATDQLRMTGDVVVNPIPSNYGLITWDGIVLTVS